MLTPMVERQARNDMGAQVRLTDMDSWLLVATSLLLAFGLLMVASASMPLADDLTGQPFYFVARQASYVLLGLVVAAMVLRISMETWYRSGRWLLAAAIAMLLLVLVPGIGNEVNGSMRWVQLGPINIQVSEIAKLFTIVYLAGYLQRHSDAVRTSTWGTMRPVSVMAVIAVLLLLEPDFGAMVVLFAMALGMLFLAGVNIARFAMLQGVAIGLLAIMLYASAYRRARLVSFLDPWADPFNSGFQLTQSLIAIGRGELFGVGLGASIQKLFYLPEAHNDFLFAILAEELGLLGVVAVLGLYSIIVWRAFAIGFRAERLEMGFAAFLAYGVGLWFAIQALINMGVNMGLLPTKGLTLPLMSYGGSSIVVMCAALAMLLRVDCESRAQELEHGLEDVAPGHASRSVMRQESP